VTTPPLSRRLRTTTRDLHERALIAHEASAVPVLIPKDEADRRERVHEAKDAVAGTTCGGGTHNMEPTEIQAKATIAAALILSRAVELPTIPTSGDWSKDTAALRLRDLTDYVYQMITSDRGR
jgi:hypothetical protein